MSAETQTSSFLLQEDPNPTKEATKSLQIINSPNRTCHKAKIKLQLPTSSDHPIYNPNSNFVRLLWKPSGLPNYTNNRDRNPSNLGASNLFVTDDYPSFFILNYLSCNGSMKDHAYVLLNNLHTQVNVLDIYIYGLNTQVNVLNIYIYDLNTQVNVLTIYIYNSNIHNIKHIDSHVELSLEACLQRFHINIAHTVSVLGSGKQDRSAATRNLTPDLQWSGGVGFSLAVGGTVICGLVPRGSVAELVPITLIPRHLEYQDLTTQVQSTNSKGLVPALYPHQAIGIERLVSSEKPHNHFCYKRCFEPDAGCFGCYRSYGISDCLESYGISDCLSYRHLMSVGRISLNIEKENQEKQSMMTLNTKISILEYELRGKQDSRKRQLKQIPEKS